jgi:hypothetical protein
MTRTRRLASVAAVVTALAVGGPVLAANAAPDPAPPPTPPSNPGSPHCPSWYTGPTNLATGCPYWIMVP